MDKKNNLYSKIQKSYKKKSVNKTLPVIAVAAISFCVLSGSFVIISNADKREKSPFDSEVGTEESPELLRNLSETEPAETGPSEEELEEIRIREEKDAAINGYSNLGIVQVSGYLNVRQSADTGADVIGKIYGDGACEILETTESGWHKISSGGLEGYISGEFVLTGEEAKEKALELVELRVIVLTDNLNIRKEPSTESDSVGKVLQNERYVVKSQQEGWIEINNGFISSEFAEVSYALNEARKLDMREMVVNLYDNMGISNVSNYLNIREKPSEDGKIIGKMPSKSAGEILESTDGWYKIKSGPVTGYVKSDYILTGSEAKTAAMKSAVLMVTVSTETLNVRKEASTESAIWTQISNKERYLVVSQQDGWVEIEMDTTTGFVSTDYVEVHYALEEAIKFTPLPDTPPSQSAGGSSSGSGSKGNSSSAATGKAGTNQSKRSQVVNYALQFLGNPYVWGGSSLTSGADCSGFTMAVYSKFGVSLPHHSGSQAGRGKAVSSDNMRPGDLIFYANSGGSINHVAMYIGNGQVVHASSQKTGIKISTWNYRSYSKIVNVLGD